MVDILTLILGVTKLQALMIVLGMIAITSSISTLSGLWGVLVTDVFQFAIKMGMVIVLAVYAVNAVVGIDMKVKLAAVDVTREGRVGAEFVSELNSAWMPLITFSSTSLNWVATWYPGRTGRRGYIAQRMFAPKMKNSLPPRCGSTWRTMRCVRGPDSGGAGVADSFPGWTGGGETSGDDRICRRPCGAMVAAFAAA